MAEIRIRKTCLLNKLTTKLQIYARVCNENKEKLKRLPYFFVLKKVKLRQLIPKANRTDQDKTSSIKASYNKGIILL